MSRSITWGLVAVLAACSPYPGEDRSLLPGGWPEWQRIETGELPATWQVEEASMAFDAWEAIAVVTSLSTTDDVTEIRFDDGRGGVLDLRMAALPSGRFAPELAEADRVRVGLVRREGFEGVAQGLVVRDAADQLLLLYDDGGYGPAFYGDGERAGLSVDRSLKGLGTGDDWASREVTFHLADETVSCAEGETVHLGTEFAAKLVVSREWTGEVMTDIDLAPLAYMLFRVSTAP